MWVGDMWVSCTSMCARGWGAHAHGGRKVHSLVHISGVYNLKHVSLFACLPSLVTYQRYMRCYYIVTNIRVGIPVVPVVGRIPLRGMGRHEDEPLNPGQGGVR